MLSSDKAYREPHAVVEHHGSVSSAVIVAVVGASPRTNDIVLCAFSLELGGRVGTGRDLLEIGATVGISREVNRRALQIKDG